MLRLQNKNVNIQKKTCEHVAEQPVNKSVFLLLLMIRCYCPRVCPFVDLAGRPVTTAEENVLECMDGSTCNAEYAPGGWSCCNRRGGRAKCPPNLPSMCESMVRFFSLSLSQSIQDAQRLHVRLVLNVWIQKRIYKAVFT